MPARMRPQAKTGGKRPPGLASAHEEADTAPWGSWLVFRPGSPARSPLWLRARVGEGAVGPRLRPKWLYSRARHRAEVAPYGAVYPCRLSVVAPNGAVHPPGGASEMPCFFRGGRSRIDAVRAPAGGYRRPTGLQVSAGLFVTVRPAGRPGSSAAAPGQFATVRPGRRPGSSDSLRGSPIRCVTRDPTR